MWGFDPGFSVAQVEDYLGCETVFIAVGKGCQVENGLASGTTEGELGTVRDMEKGCGTCSESDLITRVQFSCEGGGRIQSEIDGT